MADINDLIAHGITPPQVETLGDAFARMRANEQARALGKQQLTLGDLSTEEGRLKLAQMRRDAEADQRGRELFAGGDPQQAAPPAQQAAPPAAVQPPGPAQQAAPQGAPAAAAVTPAPQQQAAPQQPQQPQQPPGPRPRPTAAQIYGAYGPRAGAAIVEAMTKADAAGVDLQTKKSKLGADLLDFEGNLASMVKAAGYSPDAVEQAMHMLEDHGYASEAQQLRAHIAQDPTQVKALMDQAIAASPKQAELATAAQSAAARTKTAGTSAAKQEIEAPGQRAQVAQQLRANAAAQLAAAAERGPGAVNVLLNSMEPSLATQFAGAKTPAEFLRKGLTAEQITQSDQAALNAKNTEADRKVTQGQGAQRIGIEGARLNLAQKEYQQKFGDVLGSLSPNNKAIAEKVAAGDYSVAQLARLPGKEAIFAGAIAINPALSQATYDTKQSFTNPEKTQAKNLGTISRIVGHIGRFEQNSKAIGFAPAYASGMNLTGEQNKLNEDAHAIAGELEKLVSGGVGAVAQTQAWQKSLHSPSAGARQQAIDEISRLIGSQYEGMNQTYKAALYKDLPLEKYVTPAGRAWLKTKGIDVGGAAPAAAVNPFR